jgi:hypothetical protein
MEIAWTKGEVIEVRKAVMMMIAMFDYGKDITDRG